ncbi:MAG: ribosome recycling factor [Bacilli bacterium]|nr:ribosome recycling factor [Bacilli bacterium]
MDDTITNMKLEMDKGMETLSHRFGTVRAGRANPASLDGVMVEYYGQMTPLKSVATISVPEARILVIKPYDKHALADIEKAIFNANLGYTPSNDGETIRIVIPELTEDRREELVKQVKKIAEDAKVVVRNIRRDAMDDVKKNAPNDDEKDRLEKRIQDEVNEYNKKIDEELKKKEEELRTV